MVFRTPEALAMVLVSKAIHLFLTPTDNHSYGQDPF